MPEQKKLNAIQLLTNSSYMMSLIFIPLLANELGASYVEVGMIVSGFGAAMFISSFIFGKAADKHSFKTIIKLGLGVSAIAYFLQVFAYDPQSLAIARAFAGFSTGMYPAAMIVYVHTRKQSIGKFSSYGALGWAVGFLAAGIIGDMRYLFALSSLFYLVSFILATKLDEIESVKLNISYFSIDTFTRNWVPYFSFFIRHVGAVAIWTIFPLYLKSLGASVLWIGILFTINPAVQIVVMRRLDMFRNERLMIWGYVLSAIAFFAYLPAQNFLHIIPGMVLVAVSWSFMYVGLTQLMIVRNTDKATSIGLVNSMVSMATIIGPVAGGWVAQLYGFGAVIAVGGLLSIVGLLMFWMFDRPKRLDTGNI